MSKCVREQIIYYLLNHEKLTADKPTWQINPNVPEKENLYEKR